MSKRNIRPAGAEGISHPRNVAKLPFTVNEPSTSCPRPADDGFAAAKAWHVALCESADAAKGYLFPSGLRQAYEALPASAQLDFLDAVGALFVSFEVIGRPVPGRQTLRTEVLLQRMSPQGQDLWAQEQEDLEGSSGGAA